MPIARPQITLDGDIVTPMERPYNRGTLQSRRTFARRYHAFFRGNRHHMPPASEVSDFNDAETPFFVGVDVGGTNIKVGLLDNEGRTLAKLSLPTDAAQGPEASVQRMGTAVHEVAERTGLKPEQIAWVGLGTPGTMDIPAGKLLEPPNLPGWEGFPIRDRLSEACDRPVTFANDAAAAAYGEFWVGSGRDLHSMVFLTLGTGVGCGIIVGGLSLEGEHSHGAECGHIIIDFNEDARVCSCGQPGHLEAYASAVAVVKRTAEALEEERDSSLRQRLQAGEELTPLLIAEEAEGGDALSLEIVLETARYLGVGVVSLMHTIDPNGVVLGGAMNFGGEKSELGQRFLQRVRQEVSARAFPIPAQNTSVNFAALGGDAGYIGAAGLARQAARQSARNSTS